MKADGHIARDVAKYLGVSRATLYRYLADEAALAPGGGRPRCFTPGGGTTDLRTPGGGIDRLLRPRRGHRQSRRSVTGAETLHDFKIRQLPLVPTCQWVKGDSIS